MPLPPVIVYYSSAQVGPPEDLLEHANEQGYKLVRPGEAKEVLALVNRSHPSLVVLDGDGDMDEISALIVKLRSDPFSAIVPVVAWSRRSDIDVMNRVLEAGADDCLKETMDEREKVLRLNTVVRRAERDVGVHPTTRLPGTAMIERDIAARLAAGEDFAVCYADIDHFKEFNDRYGYQHGDRVILLVSKILRDVVKEFAPDGFIGHIGGDDFIFNVSMDIFETCCREVISIFDTLIPFQYSEEDRKAGFFWGKDRRGQLHRIPLMTLSVGIVTNQQRSFTHTAQVGELATEMKAYAKTKQGSIYVVDRRHGRRDTRANKMPRVTDEAEKEAS
ncbi:MAG: diguanylate cyclase [Gemmatimonadetes bacterium]|uniref:diguanylate cyclase n=1 Tax=Candidatus Kutchimonas denitrificans TaxID=3056748 RepID=A0AAE4Z7W1_9BACT|nr:diguanylate cyclase [Gemmatimonadota bacterium]NIR75293.1 diguanylate cyclase [Candidatus Kutchimonas denitrificans]NIS00231.1 diguanylate cyclase [Gemmatimonadota bacterium]NIT65823.1 diguanylate cyclase [Gemmatimonadota bacterium]NIU53101.1 diguanylate cyclase [Gemmatimonadota bacterium]